MTFDIKKTGMTALVALSLLCTSPVPTSAQFGGFFGGGDGLGDIVGILGGILDQTEMIATAAETIVANGEFGDLAPLLPEIQQVLELLEQAETLSFNVETVLADFEESPYPAKAVWATWRGERGFRVAPAFLSPATI